MSRGVAQLCEVSPNAAPLIFFLFGLGSAVSAYAVRMRVINELTEAEQWATVAMVPQVDAKLETMSREKAARLKKLVLQKALYLVFRRVMHASHFGAKLKLKDGSTVMLSPRLLGYQCDYLEERNVMCLKQHGGDFDCTSCMAPSHVSCTAQGVGHEERPVLPTVDANLKAATLLAGTGYSQRVKDLEKEFGISPCVPALAGWAGLGSGPRLLYKAPMFDQLHVSSLCGTLSVLRPFSRT